jgi:putative transcriptional regulator
MPIIVKLDEMLVKRKQSSRALAEFVGITEQNISLIKTGRIKGIRFSTLDKLCEFLECQPGDLFDYESANVPAPTQRLAVSTRGRK